VVVVACLFDDCLTLQANPTTTRARAVIDGCGGGVRKEVDDDEGGEEEEDHHHQPPPVVELQDGEEDHHPPRSSEFRDGSCVPLLSIP
jgi:hypothetical protein